MICGGVKPLCVGFLMFSSVFGPLCETDPVLMSLKDGYHRPNQLVFKAPVKEKKSVVVNGIDLLENVPPRTENEVRGEQEQEVLRALTAEGNTHRSVFSSVVCSEVLAVLCRYFKIFLTTVCLNSLDDSARLSRPSQPAPEQHLRNQLQTGKVIALELILIYSNIIIYTLIYCFSYITVFLLCISKIQAANWRQLSF